MLAAVLALWTATLGPADHRSEHIPLRHCTTVELLPFLQPIVEGHGHIRTPDSQRLLVTSSPPRVAQVRDVVLALDVPPRTLRLSVRQEATYRLRAFEGFEAWIAIRREPAPDRREALVLADGIAVADDWWAEALGDAFTITPSVEREWLLLRVRTVRGSRSHATTIEGALGAWIEIGGALEDHAMQHEGPRFEPDRARRLESSVQVMVETLE